MSNKMEQNLPELPEVVVEVNGKKVSMLEEPKTPTSHMNAQLLRLLKQENNEQGRSPLPFLPNKNGYCNVTAAKTVDGYELQGIQQLMAKVYLHNLGRDNDNICTFNNAVKHGTAIRKGEHGFYLPYYDNKENKVRAAKHFAASQVKDKDKLPYVDTTLSKQEQRNSTAFVQESPNPYEYIENYLKCVHENRSFTTSPEVANKFKEQLAAEIQKAPLSLFKICNQAQKHIYEQDLAQGKIKPKEKQYKQREVQKQREAVER